MQLPKLSRAVRGRALACYGQKPCDAKQEHNALVQYNTKCITTRYHLSRRDQIPVYQEERKIEKRGEGGRPWQQPIPPSKAACWHIPLPNVTVTVPERRNVKIGSRFSAIFHLPLLSRSTG